MTVAEKFVVRYAEMLARRVQVEQDPKTGAVTIRYGERAEVVDAADLVHDEARFSALASAVERVFLAKAEEIPPP